MVYRYKTGYSLLQIFILHSLLSLMVFVSFFLVIGTKSGNMAKISLFCLVVQIVLLILWRSAWYSEWLMVKSENMVRLLG